MLPLDALLPAVRAAIPKFRPTPNRGPSPNDEQATCILHPPATPLQIVAGPGSGKTTVLVLRALRHVVVDGLLPEQVLLTTFTKKAAAEIRTRLIEWGQLLLAHLRLRPSAELAAHLERVDVNRFVTGTLDSICEEALRDARSATDPAPALLEGFAANAILFRRGLSSIVYKNGKLDPEITALLAKFTFDQQEIYNAGELTKVARPLFDRFSHDRIDLQTFRTMGPDARARDALVRGYEQYSQELQATNRLDFAKLEATFLERLQAGRLQRFTDRVRAILVDEYQDTNLLQEEIYFELFRRTEGSTFTVVGDDDQSLYRFRGATVELFRDFVNRLQVAVPGRLAKREDLVSNYRSTPEIVAHFNGFIANDPDFAPARVTPPKPKIQAQLPSIGLPVLGMFRDSAEDLAESLAKLLIEVFRGPGKVVRPGLPPLKAHPDGGDFGDAVLLAHSVNEFKASYRGEEPKPRLPFFLRQQLQHQGGIRVFNPRGQALKDIADIQELVGAMLECIDPGAAKQGSMFLRAGAVNALGEFRASYRAYAATNPSPNGLPGFVAAWGARRSQTGKDWPKEWPLLELCFKLLCWFPRLREDPEGQIHLEAVARAIGQSASFSPYKAKILHGQDVHDDRSVEAAIRDIFAPLAEGLIDVDEEIMPHVPRDRLALMTIHQAKGLEYPLVIVDVGSDFQRNHPKNRFKRFPKDPSNVALMEDDLAAACPIGPLRQKRTGLQRTFEDLIRLYYVAYSRPQTALLLVGLTPTLRYAKSIPNVAVSWRADETWQWRTDVPGKKKPALANAHPLELI